jgi:rod shape-determining protein MreC
MRRLTRRQQVASSVLAVLALLFITLDFAGGSFSGARGGTSGSLGSLYRGADSVLGPVRRFIQGVPDVGRNRTQIAQLQKQNRVLQQQLTDARLDSATAAALKSLQLQAGSAGWTVMPARVIALNPAAGEQWQVTVDVGSRERVLAGQTVTDGAGLVGRVLSVHQSTSVILLAADPSSAVGVRDARSGELLLVKGGADGELTATPLDDQVDVRAGDRLVSGPSGQSTFVAGLPVGTVTSVTTSAGGAVRVAVKPAAAQRGLDLLGIILASPRTAVRSGIDGTTAVRTP